MRVLFVCSSGGHLDQLLALMPAPEGVDVAFATFRKPDSLPKLAGHRVHGLSWPTNRSIRALVVNLWIAVRTLRAERPDYIVSSGAAAAVPFAYVGKAFFRTHNVFVECIDRIDNPTLTARLVRPVTDQFIAQWDGQLAGFPRRTLVRRSK
ncbi:UDP-N-acetylglucosamine--LPS N-acetylglucosamine transferase [Curtobacterium sp. YR515]|uniref:UDP-N-acetylglucosamine--LPS N-acetylglucosamine transferase n=1 Tax=Curtobacterium sp. YR515 TaxID=1855316 RepID=UPI0008ED5DCC|nr:UDP-N-acetylglucosamine--LPS N-acetylglucosamine transferase [Curtobacterium sp. YR515]SFF44652.1 Oligosaccharide biosynthesis protein Alg14 like [Curtobacterium sp. YR515]